MAIDIPAQPPLSRQAASSRLISVSNSKRSCAPSSSGSQFVICGKATVIGFATRSDIRPIWSLYPSYKDVFPGIEPLVANSGPF